MKKTLSTLLMVSTLALSAASFAGGHGGPFLLQPEVAEKLALTDSQRTEIGNLWDHHRALYPRDRSAHKEQRAQMRALIGSPSFDREAARALLLADVDKRLARLQLHHDLRQVLTEQQREQIAKRHKRHKRGGERHHPKRD